jgi:uncharacterized lipoprotein NlpE involved in copper resistance
MMTHAEKKRGLARRTFAVLVFALAVFALGIAGCATKYVILNDGHNSRNSLDWWGIYEGTLPAASAPGMNMRLVLNQDETFAVSWDYEDRDGTFSATGTFSWDTDGNIITLEGDGFSSMFQVAEGSLRQLDTEGNAIEGQFAENYVLRKVR